MRNWYEKKKGLTHLWNCYIQPGMNNNRENQLTIHTWTTEINRNWYVPQMHILTVSYFVWIIRFQIEMRATKRDANGENAFPITISNRNFFFFFFSRDRCIDSFIDICLDLMQEKKSGKLFRFEIYCVYNIKSPHAVHRQQHTRTHCSFAFICMMDRMGFDRNHGVHLAHILY